MKKLLEADGLASPTGPWRAPAREGAAPGEGPPPGQAGGRLLAARMGGHRAWAHTTACADHMLF